MLAALTALFALVACTQARELLNKPYDCHKNNCGHDYYPMCDQKHCGYQCESHCYRDQYNYCRPVKEKNDCHKCGYDNQYYCKPPCSVECVYGCQKDSKGYCRRHNNYEHEGEGQYGHGEGEGQYNNDKEGEGEYGEGEGHGHQDCQQYNCGKAYYPSCDMRKCGYECPSDCYKDEYNYCRPHNQYDCNKCGYDNQYACNKPCPMKCVYGCSEDEKGYCRRQQYNDGEGEGQYSEGEGHGGNNYGGHGGDH